MEMELPLIVGQSEALLQRIQVVKADLVEVCAEVIVSPADTALLGHGSAVDAAVHRAAGPALIQHTQSLAPCPVGGIQMTPSFNLASAGIKKIIHAVGPVWQGDEQQKLSNNAEDVFLASCYHWSLEKASNAGFKSIAFASISTCQGAFPKQRAAKIAFGHVHGFLLQHPLPQRVIFCCDSDQDVEIYQQIIAGRGDWMYARKRI